MKAEGEEEGKADDRGTQVMGEPARVLLERGGGGLGGRETQSSDVDMLDWSCPRVAGADVHQPAGSLGVARRENGLKLWGRLSLIHI